MVAAEGGVSAEAEAGDDEENTEEWEELSLDRATTLSTG
jgi:hypothetical protein